MTTRDFDPVLSAALRNELEALAGGADRAPLTPLHLAPLRLARRLLARPQVWVTAITALVLVVATLGVLRITAPPPQPATATPAVVDPLSRITDPASASYVARSVPVLLVRRGVGTGTAALDVPPGTTDMQVYLNCSGSAPYAVERDHEGAYSSDACDRDTGSSYSQAVVPGAHTITVRVRPGVRWSLLVIRTPGPTLATGALIDPEAQVRDLRNPDAVVGDVRTLLASLGGRGDGAASTPLPEGVHLVRVYLACLPASAATSVVVGGHTISGCQNAIAHWADVRVAGGTLDATVRSPGGTSWSLLVIRSPRGAEESPANAVLPYPGSDQRVLAQARGSGAAASGTFRQPHDTILITTTCRGTGWLEIRTGASGTTTRGTACSTSTPQTVGFGGGHEDRGKRQAWRVIPHGDISWTFRITDDR